MESLRPLSLPVSTFATCEAKGALLWAKPSKDLFGKGTWASSRASVLFSLNLSQSRQSPIAFLLSSTTRPVAYQLVFLSWQQVGSFLLLTDGPYSMF